MKLFKNEKLEKVNDKIAELTSKREALETEVNAIVAALEETIQSYATGEGDEELVQKAKGILEAKTKEIAEATEMLSRVKGVRKSVAIESIPFVKKARDKKVEAIQAEYDKKAIEVQSAKNEFLRKLGELGQVKSKVSKANEEFNSLMVELGETPSIYGATILEAKLHSPQGFTSEGDCIGALEKTQHQIYSSGDVPLFAKGEK